MDGVRVEARERRAAQVLAGSSIAEATVSAGAAVLAIIALAGTLPVLLISIATIGVGVSLLFVGAATSAKYARMLQDISGGRIQTTDLTVGSSAETLGGIAGIVLGILSLIGWFQPATLIPIAAIVFGAAIMFGAGVNSRLNAFQLSVIEERPHARRAAEDAVAASSGLQVLAGIAAITLGILALLGIESLNLSIIAILVVAVSDILSGSALGTRMMSMFS